MYGNFYNNYPNPMPWQYQNLYQNRLEAMQQAHAARYEITRVNGKNGAEALQLPPNSSVLLLDETAPIVWLAQTDGAGYKTTTPYAITPYQQETPVDTRTLEQRVVRLEEILNGKSDFTGTKRNSAGADANAE